MRRCAALGAAVLAAAIPAPARAAGVARATVPTPDGPRTYLVARPSRPAAGPRPLVLVLHGHGGSADQALGVNGKPSPLGVWVTISEREGVIVSALEGAPGGDGKRGWNDCRADAPANPRTDDVAFVRAVIARFVREEGVDPTRVYAMGMSNGGFMVFRLALELDPPLAAIAAVSSSMAADSACGPPRRPVSVLIVSGTADPLVPYLGGDVRLLGKKRGSVLAVEDAATIWRRADGISDAPARQPIAHRGGADDPTSAVRTTWGVGAPQVELIRVDGGGHAEPSVSQRYGRLYRRLVGRQNHDLEIAEEAWSFFKDKRAGVPAR